MAMVWFRVVLLQGIVFQSEKSRWTCVEGMRKQSLLGTAKRRLEELAQISLGFVGRLRGRLIELTGGLGDSYNPNPAQRVISMPPISPFERKTTIASTVAVMSAISASVAYSGFTRLTNSGALKPVERGEPSPGTSSTRSAGEAEVT